MFRAVCILMAVCVATAPALGQQSKPTGVEAPPAARAVAITDELDRAVLRAELGRFWGAVLVARKGEVLLAKGYGFANDELEPIGRDSLFDIGSIAKMFTAAAVLRLQADGKLSVSDPLSKFFPDAGGAADRITLHHLLSHTSGKSDEAGAIQPLNYEDRGEAVKLFARSRSAHKPGEEFEYCNGGYVVLGAVVEVVSGKKFEQAVRELVLRPAGMNGSGFLDGAGLDAAKQTMRVVHNPYGGERRGPLLDKKIEPWAWGLRGAGGLVTSVDDLLAWDAAIRSHAVLDARSTEAWTTPVKGVYAYGWMVSVDEDGRRVHRHAGGTRGYRCDLVRYPEQEVVIVVLSGETGAPPSAIVEALATVVFPPAPSRTDAVFVTAGREINQFRALVHESGVEVKVVAENGKVRLSVEPKPDEVLANFTLDPGAARKLARKLRETLESEEHRKAQGGVKAGVFLYQYPDAVKAGSLRIGNMGWMTMPGYRGRGEDGKVETDDRIVLAGTDPQNEGFWPFMMHLDDVTAERVAKELEAAGK